MRQLVATFVLLVLAPLAALANDTKGVVVEKSFLQSVQDCVEYLQIPRHRLVQYLAYEFPPDDETKCLIYCVGTDLRWWNSTCGLQFPAIVNYFQPVQGDRQYEKRTKECLERNVRSVQLPNHCCQAYESFQCYFREFGNLVTCPQYVPPTKLQATQAALDCLTMLRVPLHLLRCYSEGDLPDVRETHCMFHCVDLRTGLYTPEHGLHLSRFYVRDRSVDDLRYLGKETNACRNRVRQSGCNTCSEVYNTHRDCLAGIGVTNYTSDLITEAAKMALANRDACCSEKVSPVPEEGYSYASYQPVPDVPSKPYAASVLPITLPHSLTPPASSRQPFRSRPEEPKGVFVRYGAYPAPVANFEPFAKYHLAPLRPQRVLHPEPRPDASPFPQTVPMYEPAFSAFSSRSFPRPTFGPYPSCAGCEAEPLVPFSTFSA